MKLSHTTRRRISGLVLACLPILASGCGHAESTAGNEQSETISVRPIFAEGTSLRYAHALSTEDTNDIPNAGSIAIQATIVRGFTLDVISVDDDANARVTITLDSFQLHMQQNGSTLILFSSEAPSDSPRSAERALLELIGVTLEATLDTDGQVIAMQSLAEFFDPSTPIQPQARPFYDDAWFRAAIENVWRLKTDSHDLAPADTWDITTQTVFNEMMSVSTTLTYELVEFNDSEARINGEGHAELSFTPDSSSDLENVEIDEQAYSSLLVWNRSLGALDLYETEQRLDLTYHRAGLQTSSRRRSNTSLRRLPDPPAVPLSPSSQGQSTPEDGS
ncbi:MAG: DUF6263 family protein [Planctomycetota bacterium]|jgi:hypothetical protein